MPRRAKTPCQWPGCRRLVRGRRCAEHQVADRARHDDNSAETRRAHRKFYGRRWRKLRDHVLAESPFCLDCLEAGRTVLATEVDHVTPHRGDATLAYDYDNLQPLCRRCHSRKTAREVGFSARPQLRASQ